MKIYQRNIYFFVILEPVDRKLEVRNIKFGNKSSLSIKIYVKWGKKIDRRAVNFNM